MAGALRFRLMRRDLARTVIRMRALAARMRAYAAQTSVALFRRQFESTAADLEEAASDLASRAGTDVPERDSQRDGQTKRGAPVDAPHDRRPVS